MFVEGIAVGLIILAVVEFCLLFSLVIWEKPFAAAITFGMSLFAADFFFGTNILSVIWEHPLMIVLYAAGYVFAGVAWSFPRWWFYVRKIRDEYKEEIRSWKCARGFDENVRLTGDSLENFKCTVGFKWKDKIPPRAAHNKARILTWMAYWPVSMVWTLIDEPFKRAFQFLFEKIRGIYQVISERAFDGIEAMDANS